MQQDDALLESDPEDEDYTSLIVIIWYWLILLVNEGEESSDDSQMEDQVTNLIHERTGKEQEAYNSKINSIWEDMKQDTQACRPRERSIIESYLLTERKSATQQFEFAGQTFR